MEMAHSRALIAVEELGSFSKAGERLNLSPPAIFAQIHQLEQELGEKLYERAGRKLLLTPAGRLMAEYCHRLIQIHDEAVGAVRELNGLSRGSLYLGCGAHISVAIVPHLLQEFVKSHPHVDLRVSTGNDDILFQDLQAGKVDLALMNLPVDELGLVQDPLWRYELVFVVPPDDPAAEQGTISAVDLAMRRFIVYERSIVSESAVRQFCEEVGFEPNVVMQNDQADSIKELVKLGVGISLLPLWSVADEVRLGTLRILRLANRHLFSETGLIHRKSVHLSRASRGFIELAHQWQRWMPQPHDVLQIFK